MSALTPETPDNPDDDSPETVAVETATRLAELLSHQATADTLEARMERLKVLQQAKADVADLAVLVKGLTQDLVATVHEENGLTYAAIGVQLGVTTTRTYHIAKGISTGRPWRHRYYGPDSEQAKAHPAPPRGGLSAVLEPDPDSEAGLAESEAD